jgi:hypothetical protein
MVDKTRLAKMQKMRGHTKTECKSKGTSMTGYYCVVCGKFLPADEHGVIVHDNVPHPVDMDFADEEKPQ